MELGWCGTNSEHYPGLVPQLIWKQIMYANGNGFWFILGEFDTTDEYAMEVLKTFPFPPSATWITYQK